MNLKEEKQLLTGKYAAHLLSVVIKGGTADDIPSGISWAGLYAFCKAHGVSGMVYNALANKNIPENIRISFYEDYKEAVLRDAMFDEELQAVITELENNSVHALILKGHAIKKYYPQSYMRSLADADIVFDSSMLNICDDIMKNRGFDKKAESHDVCVYNKAPIFNFEMHKAIDMHDDRVNEYYRDILMRLPLDDNYKYIHTMSAEDLYIFSVIHLMKHILSCGAGARFLVDLWVLRNTPCFDMKYVDNELERLGFSEFSEKISYTLDILFEKRMSTENFDKLLLFLFSNGVYGTILNAIVRDVDNGSTGIIEKMRFLWFTYLHSEAKYRNYPVLKKCLFLFPFCVVHTYVRALVNLKETRSSFNKYLVLKKKRSQVLDFLGLKY